MSDEEPKPNVMYVTDSQGERLFTITVPLGTYGVEVVRRGEARTVAGPAVIMAGVSRW